MKEASNVTIHDPEKLSRDLTAYFERFASRNKGVHHALMSLRRGDGSFEWESAHGTVSPDGPPLTPETPYFIASVTKIYTAAAVLLLMEQGRISLTDPISHHLPEGLVDGLHRVGSEDHTSTITVRHLLANTSGLANFYEDRDSSGTTLQQRLFAGEDPTFDLDDVICTVRDEMKPHFAPLPLDAEGKRAFYSDTNFQLLGAILEYLTDKSLSELFRELIFAPLDLRETYLYGRGPAAQEDRPRPPLIWHKKKPMNVDRVMSCFGADGALVSTTADQHRFLQALFQGHLFARDQTLELMQERWNKIWFPMEYGLGLMRIKSSRLLSPLRPPPTIIGHSGSSGSWLYFCPALDLYLAGTIDQTAPRSLPFRLLIKILQIVDQASER